MTPLERTRAAVDGTTYDRLPVQPMLGTFAAHCHRVCGHYHIVAPGCDCSPLTPPANVRALRRYAEQAKE